jgi:hypothetical protein
MLTYKRGSSAVIELPQGRMEFQGGTVMRINVSTSLLDYLDGTVDGDVEILDLLFGVEGFKFLIFDAGLLCVVLDDPPGGGTFNYDVLAQEATFDMIVNTKALVTDPYFAANLPGGAFIFPFALNSTIPLTLLDAVGLFTGTSSVEVTQPLDMIFTTPFWLHVKGEVTLYSTDSFPATPAVLSCVDYLSAH